MSYKAYFSVIFATGSEGEFGYKNDLPWGRIKEDMKFFNNTTTDTDGNKDKVNAVIMGRNTFESIGCKPLKGRVNIIITSKMFIQNSSSDTIYKVLNLDEALIAAKNIKNCYRTFVIGGEFLLHQCMTHPNLEHIYKTTVQGKGDFKILCDRKFHPIYPTNAVLIKTDRVSSEKYDLTFETFSMRKEGPEMVYLKLCEDVLNTGTLQVDRTGVGTIAKFGQSISFDMFKYGFPLFTTKKIFWRGVVEELFFFLSGKTNTKVLEDKKVFIWSGNTNREYLDKYGFTDYPEGEMGPGYPHQWRHFGAEWVLGKQLELNSEKNNGVDQIATVIENIKKVKSQPNHPVGRRLVVSAWNPVDLPKMALAPCHFSFVFSVDGGFLHCSVNMRSTDLGCGLGFNIASYALLTYMIGHITNLIPGVLTFNMTNAHIYLNHVDAIKEQIARTPRTLPTLEFSGIYKHIDDFTPYSIVIKNYDPHPPIKMEMAK